MQLIDTHAHIYLEHYDGDISDVIKRAVLAGVSRIVLPNVDENTIAPMLNVCTTYPEVCIPAIAIHPTSVKKSYIEQCALVQKQIESGKYHAIGETGIDLYWDKTLVKEQCIAFEKHIELAVKYDLPLIIHSRNSLTEIFNILEKHKDKNLRGVFHCFPGDSVQALKAVKLGFLIGIGGVVTYKNSKMSKVVEEVGIENILLETDAPYLSPIPKRGKRNEPGYLIYIAEKIAEIKNIPLSIIASVTTENAVKLFNL